MVRDYQPEDAESVKLLHKSQGFDYASPNLDNPLFLVKKVREIDGRVVAVCAMRLTLETYLLVEGSPETKARSILELQPEVLHEAYEKGLSDVFFVVPPEIASEFGPVVERLGWSKDREWPMYSRDLDGTQRMINQASAATNNGG